MARKEKLNVEYYPHFISSGKKMPYIKKKYPRGLGYSVWNLTLECLAKADYHFLDVNDEITLLYLSAECDCEPDEYREIINDIVRVQGFDKELWELGVVWSEKLHESVQDVWVRRTAECLTKQDLLEKYGVKKLEKKPQPRKKPQPTNNTEKIQENILALPEWSDLFIEFWSIWKNYKKKEFKFQYKSVDSEQAALNNLVELSEGIEEQAIEIIKQSMSNGWKGLFKLKIDGKKQGNQSGSKVGRDYLQSVLNDLQSE